MVSSETAGELEARVEAYLEKGSRTVLVLYPDQRAAPIFEAGGHSRPARGDDAVQIDWLAGFNVPASRFFEGL